MNEQNIGQLLQTINLLPMQDVQATANGTGVDVRHFVGELALYLAAKATAGTSPTLDVTIEESDDDSSYAAVSGAAFTQVTDADTSAAVLHKITLDVNARKRYLRAVKTAGGTDPAFDVACFGVGVKQVR